VYADDFLLHATKHLPSQYTLLVSCRPLLFLLDTGGGRNSLQIQGHEAAHPKSL
jgi:hypothetical protein